MQKNKKNERIKKIFFSFVLAIVCVFGLMSNLGITKVAYAEGEETESTYTNVVEDLSKDENFNIDDYPVVPGDTSLKLIQIAETIDKELLIYVYQPGAEKTYNATSINISTDSKGLTYNVFKLEYLNNTNALFKYKVKGLKVSGEVGRHYDISSISRKFVKGIDIEPENGNTVSEVAYKVGQLWQSATINDEVVYMMTEVETIEITDKFVGFVFYKENNGVLWPNNTSYDSHFVAFSTDRDIDRLLEAEVYYTTQKFYYGTINKSDVNGCKDLVENKTELTYTDKTSVTVNTSLFHQHSFSWERISTVDKFIEDVNFKNTYKNGLLNTTVVSKVSDVDINNLKECQWVLRFFESEVDYCFAPPHLGFDSSEITSRTAVRDVSILRLKFETDGVVYNLGVIDNKQSGSDSPINSFDIKNSLRKLSDEEKLIVLIVFIFICLILLYIFLPVFRDIIHCIGVGFVYFMKGLWWLITAPFSVFKDD